MKSSDVFPVQPPDPSGQHPRPVIRVKELSANDRHRILRHFLGLEDSDRLLRFGTVLPDALIRKYVESLDFSCDKVFGVFSHHFRLIGVGHLAFMARKDYDDNTEKRQVAEFGVSVSSYARGKGIGFRLFQRGAIHCRNADVDTLYMHCLASNQTMIHIAKKAGMQIHREYGEADAYLKLRPASAKSILKEAMDEQVAFLDYTWKANARAAVKLLRHLPGFK